MNLNDKLVALVEGRVLQGPFDTHDILNDLREKFPTDYTSLLKAARQRGAPNRTFYHRKTSQCGAFAAYLDRDSDCACVHGGWPQADSIALLRHPPAAQSLPVVVSLTFVTCLVFPFTGVV